jgi:predicted dehydrogenase
LNLIRFFMQKRIDVCHAQFVGTQCAAAICLAGDVPVTFEFAFRETGNWSEGVEFTFSKGVLTVNLPAPFAQNEIARVLLHLERKPVKLLKPRRRLWAFDVQAEAFVNDVKYRLPSIADGRDSADDLRIAEDIWKLHPMISSRCKIA